MSDCQCPYHYDELGRSGEDCNNEGVILVLGIGKVCAQCDDKIDTALKTVSGEMRDANG